MGLSGPFKLLFSEADQTYTLECPRTVKAEGIKKRRLGGSKEEEEFFLTVDYCLLIHSFMTSNYWSARRLYIQVYNF